MPPDPINGREQSTVSWEFDFDKNTSSACCDDSRFSQVTIPWTLLKPTYRGKPKVDAKPLAKDNVKRVSIMIRRSVSLMYLVMLIDLNRQLLRHTEGRIFAQASIPTGCLVTVLVECRSFGLYADWQ